MTEFYKLTRARYVNTCKRNRQICNVEPLHKQKRPWFTAECKRLYNIYHKALAAFNKCKSVENKKFYKKKTAKRKYICTCTSYLDERKTRGNILIEKEVRSKQLGNQIMKCCS